MNKNNLKKQPKVLRKSKGKLSFEEKKNISGAVSMIFKDYGKAIVRLGRE